jgi:hypothetical protein
MPIFKRKNEISHALFLLFHYCSRVHKSWYGYSICFVPYYMFRPDGAIFRYIRPHNHLFLFLLLSLHWSVFTHWECVVCMVLCDALCCKTYWISKILKFLVFLDVKIGIKIKIRLLLVSYFCSRAPFPYSCWRMPMCVLFPRMLSFCGWLWDLIYLKMTQSGRNM